MYHHLSFSACDRTASLDWTAESALADTFCSSFRLRAHRHRMDTSGVLLRSAMRPAQSVCLPIPNSKPVLLCFDRMQLSAFRCYSLYLGHRGLDVVHRFPEPCIAPGVLAGIPFNRKHIRSCGCRRGPDILVRGGPLFRQQDRLNLTWRTSRSNARF